MRFHRLFGRGLLLSSALFPITSLSFAAAQSVLSSGASFEEVVVTATRQAQVLSKVPLSVSAFTQQKMDTQGVRSIDDVVRFTPGVNFARSDRRTAGGTSVSIRGIASNAGASTTGLYIDDTPIQIRNIGYSFSNTYPAVFDLERVEVLRGPQGTLFGAGSEGGTIRFITPKPGLSDYTAYGRTELAFTEGGEASYEAGLAVGGPIIEDKLGFRLSGWYRRDGGYIDRVSYPDQRLLDANANSQTSKVFRGALAFAPNENLKLTPSLYYQNIRWNAANAYWEQLSDPNRGEFRTAAAIAESTRDKFILPALLVEWELDGVQLVSNTSYFDRDSYSPQDYTYFNKGLFTGNPYPTIPGQNATSLAINKQKIFTQELRAQSTNSESRWNWVAGVFFQRAKQNSVQRVDDLFLPQIIMDAHGIPFETFFGQPLHEGKYIYDQNASSVDKQIAGFGQVDFNLTEELKFTAGLRVARAQFNVSSDARGPVVGPPAIDVGEQKETPVTPKFGVSYQLNDDTLLYATAAKGYRVGGYNPEVGAPCAAQLTGLGLFDANGKPARPPLFKSDSVWSYEAGAKTKLFNDSVRLDTSVYWVEWSDIQQIVGLNTCGFQFVSNLGSARSRGFDLQAEIRPLEGLTLNAAVGYTHAAYKGTVKGGPAAVKNLVTEGNRIPGSPWSFAFAAEYDFSGPKDTDGYVRFDYEFRSRQSGLVPGRDPLNGSYDPNIPAHPETNFLTARAGFRWSGLDLSVFAQNLLNSHTQLSRAHDSVGSPLYMATTFRPRTVGVTLGYRY